MLEGALAGVPAPSGVSSRNNASLPGGDVLIDGEDDEYH
jgi:hypothetical protein